MQYAMMILPHPNMRYRESLSTLARGELSALLGRFGAKGEIIQREWGGASFLCFETEDMGEALWRQLSLLSSACLLGRVEGEALLPMDPVRPATCLGKDLPALLKYKGKTNETFTELLLNLAYWNSDFMELATPLTVLDPICGRATGPMVALLRGWNAVGIEIEKKDIKEANDYFTRYLEFHRIKHQKKAASRTVAGKNAAQETRYVFAANGEALKEGRGQRLELLLGDTLLADGLLGKEQAHLVFGDLPYGVQHGPAGRGKRPTLSQWIGEALPGWRRVLKPGGAIALSFNTYTLKREELIELLHAADFTPKEEAPYDGLSHWVEQAVNRDVLVATKG